MQEQTLFKWFVAELNKVVVVWWHSKASRGKLGEKIFLWNLSWTPSNCTRFTIWSPTDNSVYLGIRQEMGKALQEPWGNFQSEWGFGNVTGQNSAMPFKSTILPRAEMNFLTAFRRTLGCLLLIPLCYCTLEWSSFLTSIHFHTYHSNAFCKRVNWRFLQFVVIMCIDKSFRSLKSQFFTGFLPELEKMFALSSVCPGLQIVIGNWSLQRSYEPVNLLLFKSWAIALGSRRLKNPPTYMEPTDLGIRRWHLEWSDICS